MLNFNIQYRSNEDLLDAKKKLPQDNQDKLLIQVFTGQPSADFISKLIGEITALFPAAHLIGCTTAGEIFDGASLDQTTIISFCQFHNTRVRSLLLTQNDDLHSGGLELARGLREDDVKLAILFGCGIKNKGAINGEPLLQGFQEGCPEALVVGGQAGDNAVAVQTFVFTQDGFTDTGAACAALYGDDLAMENHYNLSWVPLGKKMTITEATGTQIISIDDRPAKDVYRHYLGENVSSRLPHSAAEYPLVVERNGVLLARHANSVTEDGALDFMAPFYTGEQVQFAFCHSGLVAESSKTLYETIKKTTPQAIFIYSCLSRKWVLGEDAKLELSPLACLAPTSGFFSYGEYYSSERTNMFLSQTMTLLAISEKTSLHRQEALFKKREYDFQESETKQVHDLQALHRLVETSAIEREQLITKLQDALAEIKTLQGLIPICAGCKNIRDDKGFWNKIEDYISKRTEAQFSHGLCPSCVKELYPQYYDEIMKKTGFDKN